MHFLKFKDTVFEYCEIPLSDKQYESVMAFLPASLEKASPGRINEFLAGRYCAVSAAKKLGHTITELPIGENRSPVWPIGLIGSITHTKSLSVAAVASSRSEVKSLGIDIENFIPNQRWSKIERLVLNESENAHFKNLSEDDHRLLRTLIFSAKESLYKVINPLAKCYIEFKEAKCVAFSLEQETFTLELVSNNPQLAKFQGYYEGQFRQFSTGLLSGIQLL